ncbi:hypothetical protein JL101_021765 [Skermanella rosea]|uniref:hypothetical protein n=1 Tax=Skermanella rosea TaxID=1817965 RepID=UPI001933CFA6|nr:hypothetical protein [Skermanella rosea]UEM02588.1 hypothetical protein JL101_021765 [Skermanella rosea]
MPIRTAARTAAMVVASILATGGASAQTAPPTAPPMGHGSHHQGHHGSPAAPPAGTAPAMPGQDAFGAIQEIVQILNADPATDWSKVDIEALRRHLIDMNEVTLNATAVATPVEGGARFEVSGEGRTLEAIRRMVPAHAREIDGMDGWTVRADPTPTGVALTATAAAPGQAAKIRALGFIGIMARGSHHQAHHLAMARGEFGH